MTRYFKNALCSAIGILMLSIIVKAQPVEVVDSTKQEGFETKVLYSPLLNEKRKVHIQLPSGINAYDRYPVLYVLDGEVQTTMVAGQVHYLSEAYKIIPKLIIVGIENTDRTRDLTPTHSIIAPDGKPDTSANAFGKRSGGGEKFLQFLKEELIPYIDSRYPTAPYKILSGHSLGGLMAVYCLLTHPDYFNAYIAISPSLQWDQDAVLKLARSTSKQWKASSKLLFFSDANEDSLFHRNQLKLDSILKTNYKSGLTFKRQFYPEDAHVTVPIKGFYDGIRFIYPDWHLPYNSSAFRKTMNSSTIIGHYTQHTKKYGYPVKPLHDEINQISRFLRNDTTRLKDAIELLLYNAINYPTSPIVQETLGDTYVKMAETEKARISYEKALQLDPKNTALQQKIARLKE